MFFGLRPRGGPDREELYVLQGFPRVLAKCRLCFLLAFRYILEKSDMTKVSTSPFSRFSGVVVRPQVKSKGSAWRFSKSRDLEKSPAPLGNAFAGVWE